MAKIDNRLKLNTDKTSMLFCSIKIDLWKNLNLNIKICNLVLKKVNKYKYYIQCYNIV